MIFISKAYAADVPVDATVHAPTAGEAFMWNMVMVGVMVVLFYVLMVMPQQRRFKEHSQMLSKLGKGDKVVTGGGLIATIDKITEGSDEVVLDLGNGQKVTALRSTLQTRNDPLLKAKKTDKK